MDDAEFKQLLGNPRDISPNDLLLKDKQNGFVSLSGWKFNVIRTIFPDATVKDVITGWNLIKEEISTDVLYTYTSIFFIRSADDYLRPKKDNEKLIYLTYENGFEPDVTELLRLCYWYYKCSELLSIKFDYKRNEIRKQIGGELLKKAKKYISEDPKQFTNELLKELEIIKNTPKPRGGFYCLRQDIFEKVSSYVSELMTMFLLVKEKFKSIFVEDTGLGGTENKKKFDMFVENIPSEVKTAMDDFPWFDQDDPDLKKELISSLRREKIYKKVNEAIEQKAKIIFLSATTSSIGKGVNKEASRKKRESISIKEAVIKAIELANSNLKSKIAVVVVTSSIDYDRKYRITCFHVSYPIMRKDDKLQAAPSILTMKDICF
jgi:hypothetical protein